MKIPKVRNCPVGKCPMCGGNLFEEVAEKRYGSPDNESIYYEKFLACNSCEHMEDIETD